MAYIMTVDNNIPLGVTMQTWGYRFTMTVKFSGLANLKYMATSRKYYLVRELALDKAYFEMENLEYEFEPGSQMLGEDIENIFGAGIAGLVTNKWYTITSTNFSTVTNVANQQSF